MINPLLFGLLEGYLARRDEGRDRFPEQKIGEEVQTPMEICHHVILVGYGRVGSLIGAKLSQAGMPMVVIETLRARVEPERPPRPPRVVGTAPMW
jgi:CPA2 family monovalent cation:H+ antiporter-2